jgi:hypothetical protein
VVIGDDMVRADKIFKTPEDPAALPAWKVSPRPKAISFPLFPDSFLSR